MMVSLGFGGDDNQLKDIMLVIGMLWLTHFIQQTKRQHVKNICMIQQ